MNDIQFKINESQLSKLKNLKFVGKPYYYTEDVTPGKAPDEKLAYCKSSVEDYKTFVDGMRFKFLQEPYTTGIYHAYISCDWSRSFYYKEMLRLCSLRGIFIWHYINTYLLYIPFYVTHTGFQHNKSPVINSSCMMIDNHKSYNLYNKGLLSVAGLEVKRNKFSYRPLMPTEIVGLDGFTSLNWKFPSRLDRLGIDCYYWD